MGRMARKTFRIGDGKDMLENGKKGEDVLKEREGKKRFGIGEGKGG